MTTSDFASALIAEIRSIYGEGFIPLHRPIFEGRERQILVDVIDSNFVSSVGKEVNEFECSIADFTGAKYAVAMVNGTSALQVALQLAGVQQGDEVLTQALTFVATCNAIAYCGAEPVFADVDRDTLGLSPQAVEELIEGKYVSSRGGLINKQNGRRLAAVVPMHTFGHPVRLHELQQICEANGLPLVEDAAESLGSFVGDKHTGTFGLMGVFSFNGNKIITTGGGGMIVTDDEELARRAKHLTTTAKIPHPYLFMHDERGYNYRLPNLNAALGVAQMEQLRSMLTIKRNIAGRYDQFLANSDFAFVSARKGTTPNFWLNAICVPSRAARDELLMMTNESGVMTRPIWQLMTTLDMYKSCLNDGLENSWWLQDRIVNIPSSVPEGALAKLEC